ncbi:MAG: hypothetical protein HY304_03160 [candidate division Zixibacteria bacterium]|nr:hypothetical protein [candidate division Zixibacteria bacterium]
MCDAGASAREFTLKGLTALIMRQAHHRGRMTAFMRQAGLRSPSIYGPTRRNGIHSG